MVRSTVSPEARQRRPGIPGHGGPLLSAGGAPPEFYYGQPWLWSPFVKWIAAWGHLLLV
jgi:hypothetical protein